MTSRVAGGLFGLGMAGLLCLVASATTPAGACSMADPCDAERQAIDAVDPVFESDAGEALEQAPTLTVIFDGYGQPWSLVLGDREFAIGEAQ